MITIFCTPKNFEGIFDIVQKNAIRSWRYLSDDLEIIIFGKSIIGLILDKKEYEGS